jgi:hypothetical protein
MHVVSNEVLQRVFGFTVQHTYVVYLFSIVSIYVVVIFRDLRDGIKMSTFFN